MLLQYGNVTALEGRFWHAAEVHQEKTIEGIMSRLGRTIPRLFDDKSGVQIFVPLVKRDLDVCDLATGNIIYARSTDMRALMSMSSVTGMNRLLTKGDSTRSWDILPIEDSYVQNLINLCEAEHRARSFGIATGSFVRLVDSDMRDLCGTVISIHDNRAVVEVAMQKQKVFINTPLNNLINLDHVPVERRVHYYSPLIEDLDDLTLLYAENAQSNTVQTDENPEYVWGRNRTCTVFLREAQKRGIGSSRELSKLVIEALKQKQLKMPSTLLILFALVKQTTMRAHPEYDNYRALCRALPDECIRNHEFEKLAREAGLPIKWKPAEERLIPGDRRRKEFRHTKPKRGYKKRNT